MPLARIEVFVFDTEGVCRTLFSGIVKAGDRKVVFDQLEGSCRDGTAVDMTAAVTQSERIARAYLAFRAEGKDLAAEPSCPKTAMGREPAAIEARGQEVFETQVVVASGEGGRELFAFVEELAAMLSDIENLVGQARTAVALQEVVGGAGKAPPALPIDLDLAAATA